MKNCTALTEFPVESDGANVLIGQDKVVIPVVAARLSGS